MEAQRLTSCAAGAFTLGDSANRARGEVARVSEHTVAGANTIETVTR